MTSVGSNWGVEMTFAGEMKKRYNEWEDTFEAGLKEYPRAAHIFRRLFDPKKDFSQDRRKEIFGNARELSSYVPLVEGSRSGDPSKNPLLNRILTNLNLNLERDTWLRDPEEIAKMGPYEVRSTH